MSEARSAASGEALTTIKGLTRWDRFRRTETVLALVLVLPSVIWVLGFIVYPVFYTAALSLNVDGLSNLGSASLELYRSALTSPEVWDQVWRTAIWTGGSLVLIVPLGLGIALLLNQDIWGLKHVRTWILLPWMFPVIIVVLIWRWLLEANVGVVNYVLQGVGLIANPIDFLSLDFAMLTVVVTNAWRWIPFIAVVMLASLQGVPRELHEAAATDGANAIHRFRYITLPHIMPALAINTFLLVMWLFNMFPPIWLMTRGGPGDATTTLPISLYHTAFERFNMEYAAVLAGLLFIFVLAFSILYWFLARRQLAGR